ncbi:RNA polymerase sigma factor [Olsenella phocaeensis]|uniref:RNA polymerase sigma factor n=1 Tax=Olsenella phocaeensis TaxID=1852385 RepID=UPI003A92DCF6
MRQGAKGGHERVVQAEARRVVDAYSDMVLRLAMSYLHSLQDGEDVCQGVLFKLLCHEGGFKSPEHERAWVIRCTVNACKDLLRSAGRKRLVPLDSVAEPTAAPDEEPGRYDELLEAVRELPEAYRLAVHLRYLEGYDIAWIAAITGDSTAAVTKRLSRARQMLRTRLGEHDERAV